MSVEFLKTLFGDKALTFDEFAKAVGDSKDIKLANLADGKYVATKKSRKHEVFGILQKCKVISLRTEVHDARL